MDKMKILVLSHIVKGWYIDTANSFVQTLIDNNALYLDYIEIYNKYGFYGTQNYLSEYISKNGINSIIYFFPPSDFYFDVYFFEKLRKEIFLVMQTGDTEQYFEVSDQYYAQAMDLVTVNNPIYVSKLHLIGVNSLPYFGWFDTKIYYRIENLQKNIDVSFVGIISDKIGRLRYINCLLKNGFNVETYGYDSPSDLISIQKKIEIYNRTKINLSFSGLSQKTRLTRKHQIFNRVRGIKGHIFEVALCGGFVLSEYAPGLENIFEIGKEIDIFHDKEELLDKVKYYLEHEEERKNIARKGYERTIRDYNVNLTVPKLLSTIDELQKKKIYRSSEIYLDEEFIRNYTTYRILWMIKFIKQLKFKFAFEELKIILKYRKLDLYQILIFLKEEFLDVFPRIKSVLKSIFIRQQKKIM